jgi:hypothetical protein
MQFFDDFVRSRVEASLHSIVRCRRTSPHLGEVLVTGGVDANRPPLYGNCVTSSGYREARHDGLRLVLLAYLILVGVVLPSPALQTANPNDQPPEIELKPNSNIFFAYGDVRFTDPGACDLSDSRYRRGIVDAIAHASEKPDFLVMTGDIVYKGDDDHDWHVFDEETKPLRDQKITILPVLGNHDVHGTKGQSKFTDHFDELKSHSQLKTHGWYLVSYGNAEFLMLDSQSSYDEHSPQGDWFRRKLKAVPEELAFLFVVVHHPLVTHASRIPSVYHCNGRNSKPVLGHKVESAEKHLNALLEQFSKAHPSVRLVVLSGHNHNYERYVVNRITYIVTAGGGATPYKIDRRPSDAYHEPGPTFHYCKFAIRGNSLTGKMYKLTLVSGAPHWEQKDEFELSVPGADKPLSSKP